jgi:hypothetical protein
MSLQPNISPNNTPFIQQRNPSWSSSTSHPLMHRAAGRCRLEARHHNQSSSDRLAQPCYAAPRYTWSWAARSDKPETTLPIQPDSRSVWVGHGPIFWPRKKFRSARWPELKLKKTLHMKIVAFVEINNFVFHFFISSHFEAQIVDTSASSLGGMLKNIFFNMNLGCR